MGLETATFVSDLDATNPLGTDLESQGDDHLRLIKAVLKATFPGASKAFYNPTTTTKTGSFSVLSTEMNRTFYVSTASGTINATLPSLASGDAGWECHFIKTTTDTNPILVFPPSGTIQSGDISGLSRTRRCIPGERFTACWSGTAWFVTRVPRAPVGAVLELPHGASTPVGYELCYGQTLASAPTLYPDFNSRNGSGVVIDKRGRVSAGKDDMGGAAASRITNAGSGIVGTTLGAAGGLESFTIAKVNLPNYNLDITGLTGTVPVGQGSSNLSTGGVSVLTATTSSNVTFGGNIPLGGSGTAMTQVQPTIISNFIVVVE